MQSDTQRPNHALQRTAPGVTLAAPPHLPHLNSRFAHYFKIQGRFTRHAEIPRQRYV